MKEEIRKDIREYYECWLGINQVYEAWAKAYGISSYGLYTLYAIWENKESCTQKWICERWMMPKQTVNTILKHFQEQGYIYMEVMEKDRRNKRILFTEKGQEYADSILKRLNQLEEEIMEKMGEKNRKAMNEASRLFLELFREAVKEV